MASLAGSCDVESGLDWIGVFFNKLKNVVSLKVWNELSITNREEPRSGEEASLE